MSIDNILKKENIYNIEPLSTLEINKIATNVSKKICDTFPDHNIDQKNLFISLARINMYKAEMPYDTSSAKYFYKNNSIYFQKNLDLNNLDTLSIHECIHFMQTVKNSKHSLVRMGLYNIGTLFESGLSLNEAAVQTLASMCNSSTESKVKYYNMDFNTISPDYYPIECAILNQIVYFTGLYPLVHSTLFSNDVFKNAFISASNVNTYNTIENNMDIILHYEENLANLIYDLQNIKSSNIKKIKKLNFKIDKEKSKILKLCIDSQNIIINNCFSTQFNRINTVEDIKAFKEKLYNFKNVLISSNSSDFYNKFYSTIMEKLDEREVKINAGESFYASNVQNDLVVFDKNHSSAKLLHLIISKIKVLLKINLSTENLIDNK